MALVLKKLSASLLSLIFTSKKVTEESRGDSGVAGSVFGQEKVLYQERLQKAGQRVGAQDGAKALLPLRHQI